MQDSQIPCKECHGIGAYWAEWGNHPITEDVIERPTDTSSGCAYVRCHRCKSTKVESGEA